MAALLFGLAQLFGSPLTRFFEWDEAIYLSEVSPFADAVFLDAHRARGITFIVAPIALITDSVAAIRAYLVGLSSLGLFLAFLPWSRLHGKLAPIAAGVFATSWLTLFYGPEVMPNLYSALVAVAAVGLALQMKSPLRFPRLAAVAGLTAATTVIRPLDGGVLAIVLVGWSVFSRNSKGWLLPGFAGLGVVVGATPWIVEAVIRFGGPLSRLERVRSIVGGGLSNNLGEYLRLLDGPLSWPDRSGSISGFAILWLSVMFALGLYQLTASNGIRRNEVLAVWGASILFAGSYIFGSDAAAPRFLLPTIAFLSIAVAYGVTRLIALGSPWKPTLVVPLLIAAFVALGWNAVVFAKVSSEQNALRQHGQLIAKELASRADGRDCFFLSSSGYPQISLASGCQGARLSDDQSEGLDRLRSGIQEGKSVFVVVHSETPESIVGQDWSCKGVSGLAHTDWKICHPLEK